MGKAGRTVCRVLAGVSFLALLLSLSALLLHWRVENEPGARRAPELLTAHRTLLLGGTAGVLLFPGLLFLKRARPYRLLLLSLGAALLLYAPLFALTLAMLV